MKVKNENGKGAMMPATIKITGLSLRDRPTQANTVDCCFFDVQIAGIILLSGCLLKRTAKGGFIASPPRVASERAAITILDNSLHHAITSAARDVYVAMGGEYGAFAGQQTAHEAGERSTELDIPQDGAALTSILPTMKECAQ